MNLNIFKTQKKFNKSEHQPNPDLYWRIVLFVTAVLFLVSVVFGVDLYLRINRGYFSESVEYSGQGKKIGKDRLDRALMYFSEREEQSEKILNSPSVADPSN